MRIDVLRLENFRCFERYELRLAKRFNLLIGDNGSGKTAMLDALSVAAGSFLLGIPGNDIHSRNIDEDDLRRVDMTIGQTATQELAGEAKVAADWFRFDSSSSGLLVSDHEVCEWTRTRGPGENNRTTRQLASAIQMIAESKANWVTDPSKNTQVVLPLLAYFGTGRLWRVLKDSQKKSWGSGSRFRGYVDCLNPASDQKTLFRWFEANERAALQKNEKRGVLEAVRAAVIAMIPDAERLWWDFDWEALRLSVAIGGKSQTIPFHFLSDGYRNMLGLVADIAFRAAVLNPQLEERAALETDGIVLIDELDLHLHPKWQRQVVPRLLATFPKVQFVATSHSPFIIQSLYGITDTQLWDLATAASLSVESKSIEDIAEQKQGVELPQQSQRFIEMEQAAENYHQLLREVNGATEEDRTRLRQKLDELSRPYSDDPAFQAFLKMERIASNLDSPVQA